MATSTLVLSTSVSGGTLQHRITYIVTNTDATTTTVTLTKVEVRFSSSDNYFPFALNSFIVSCSGTTLYTHAQDTATFYVTGTRWVTVATPSRTKSFTRGRTAAAESIAMAYTEMTSAKIDVPAKPSYVVSYHGNGGSGVPNAQTKWYGETLTLRTTVPTRTDFVFTSWNTNSSGSGTSYAAGDEYTANAAVTLYAMWEQTYRDPILKIDSVQRVDASTHVDDDLGTSVAVKFTWDLFDTPSGTNRPVLVTAECNSHTATSTSMSGLSGTSTLYIDANCTVSQSYAVTVCLEDEGGQSRAVTVSTILPDNYFPIDIRQGASGVAIGGPSTEDALDIFMPTNVIRGTTSGNPLTINDGTNDVLTVDWDGNVVVGDSMTVGSYVRALDSRLDAAASSLSENVYLSWGMMDELARYIMFMQAVEYTTGMTAAQIAARKVVNGANVDNALSLRVANDGTRSVMVSDQAAWRTGLGIGGTVSTLWVTGYSASTSGASTVLPAAGTYLLATAHNSTAALNGLWMVRTAGNVAFNLCGGGSVTVTITGQTVNVKTAVGTVNVYYMRLG